MGVDVEGSAAIHCKDADTNISPTQEKSTTKDDPLNADTSITELASKDSTHSNEIAEISEKNDFSRADTSITEPTGIDPIYTHETVCDTIQNDLHVDDSEYPYTGIPRIVIETKNLREIKDRETEIPAKLQIWGENAPESAVMDLTIRGRGNNTWGYPKKPYAIKFNEKTAFLGMPKAKKWVMLANYRDRTLIRNAVAFEIARNTDQEWVPQGRFVDVFLNGQFIGNYFICEKIEIKENRLEYDDNTFLLEFDTHYDADYKFKTNIDNYPVNIKCPKVPSDSQINYISNYVNETMRLSQNTDDSDSIWDFLDLDSYVDYFIINEIAQNAELLWPKSFYSYKSTGNKLKAGPVWDFDFATFKISAKGLQTSNGFLFKDLKKNPTFGARLKIKWQKYRDLSFPIISYIDSLTRYLDKSNNLNHVLWPRTFNYGLIGDEDEDYETAIEMLKKALTERFKDLDILFNTL